MFVQSTVIRYGDHVDTDVIIPARYLNTTDPAELTARVRQVQSGAVRYCPHGRPVAVKLRKYEVEKMFKRA